MAVQDAAHRRTLADTADAHTIAPAAVPHHHDHDDHDHDDIAYNLIRIPKLLAA